MSGLGRQGRYRNIAIEEGHQLELECGHSTGALPVVIFPTRRKLYSCPKGCGLKAERKSKKK